LAILVSMLFSKHPRGSTALSKPPSAT
jgi:hypothetical protein